MYRQFINKNKPKNAKSLKKNKEIKVLENKLILKNNFWPKKIFYKNKLN